MHLIETENMVPEVGTAAHRAAVGIHKSLSHHTAHITFSLASFSLGTWTLWLSTLSHYCLCFFCYQRFWQSWAINLRITYFPSTLLPLSLFLITRTQHLRQSSDHLPFLLVPMQKDPKWHSDCLGPCPVCWGNHTPLPGEHRLLVMENTICWGIIRKHHLQILNTRTTCCALAKMVPNVA